MMEDLEDQIKYQASIIDRQGILIEILYQTLMPHGTDKVFTSPQPPRPLRKRSRSMTPPPAPRKERPSIRGRRSRSPPRGYSDYKIHVIGSKGEIVPDDIIGYIDDKYGITITSCTVDANGYTACINCLSKEDQQLLLEEKASEIMGRFNLKALKKRMVHSSK